MKQKLIAVNRESRSGEHRNAFVVNHFGNAGYTIGEISPTCAWLGVTLVLAGLIFLIDYMVAGRGFTQSSIHQNQLRNIVEIGL